MNDTEKFIYSSLIENDKIVMKCKIIKATYKVISNKILSINKIIN